MVLLPAAESEKGAHIYSLRRLVATNTEYYAYGERAHIMSAGSTAALGELQSYSAAVPLGAAAGSQEPNQAWLTLCIVFVFAMLRYLSPGQVPGRA